MSCAWTGGTGYSAKVSHLNTAFLDLKWWILCLKWWILHYWWSSIAKRWILIEKWSFYSQNDEFRLKKLSFHSNSEKFRLKNGHFNDEFRMKNDEFYRCPSSWTWVKTMKLYFKRGISYSKRGILYLKRGICQNSHDTYCNGRLIGSGSSWNTPVCHLPSTIMDPWNHIVMEPYVASKQWWTFFVC